MIQEIAKNIYRILVPLPKNPLKELNAYLIRGNGKSLLIDTGFNQPACREALRAGLAEAGADQDHLDVIVTHMHNDHIGLAAEMVSPGGHVYYLANLKRVRAYPVKLALPAHRHSGDLKARVDELLPYHRTRANESLSIVRREPRLTAYHIAARMTWDIRADTWDDFPLNQKWFAVGEALSHLELLEGEGLVRRSLRSDGIAVYDPM